MMIKQEIYDAIKRGDSLRLRKLVVKEAYLNEDETESEAAKFSEHTFQLILDLMNDQKYLNMEGAYELLRMFEYKWECLSVDQRERLLPALEASYEGFRDWMSQFVISELLGRNYCNEAAFKALRRLKKVNLEKARSLVAMGFDYIAKKSSDKDLVKGAKAELMDMQSDVSKIVRDEATAFLQETGHPLARRVNKGKRCCVPTPKS